MFSRRRGSSKTRTQQPLDSSTYNAAATASQLAFLQKSGSNASLLSSSAAAAALRSHTASPEPVGNLQTKRIIRKSSVSSTGSGGERPGLARTNSGSSMTERRFRTPSPAKRNGVPPRSDAPPVPALPQNMGRPSSSMGAPQRITSPTPVQGARSSSVDAGPSAPQWTSGTSKRLSNVAETEERDRAHSNFAKNFSRRDISPPPSSPTASETPQSPSRAVQSWLNDSSANRASRNYTPGTGSWFYQGSTAGQRASEGRPASIRQISMSSSTTPVTQPLGGTQPVSAAGGRPYSQRTYGTTPGSTYEPPPTVYDPNSRSFVPKGLSQRSQPALQAARRAKSMETVYDPNSRSFVPKYGYGGPRMDSGASSPQSITSEPQRTFVPKQRSMPAVNTGVAPPPKNPARFSSFTIDRTSPTSARPAATFYKQPSLVQEDAQADKRAVTAVPLRQEPTDGTRATQPTVLPPKTYSQAPQAHQRSSSLDVPRGGVVAPSRGRNTSESPQRIAHFSASPILQPEIHAPPPRDLSPAKSAMKQSPSMRPVSPLASVPGPASETSETPSLAALDDLSTKKKKAARVSFDEQPKQIAPPAAVSTTTTRGRSPEVEDIGDDAIMQPRPELPSFGSVRRDRVQAAPAEKVTEMPPARHEVSSDHAIGGILKSSNDPLPPEVTSKESAGYVSDESSDPEIPWPNSAAIIAANNEEKDVSLAQDGEPKTRDFAAAPDLQNEAETTGVPAIALMPPTPRPDDDDSKRDLVDPSENENFDDTRGRNSMEGMSMPGGWHDEVERAPAPAATPVAVIAKPTSEAPSMERRASAEDSAATMTVTPIPITVPSTELSVIDEDTDDSAEFSDAFEDPSDFEDNGGFASLDAIVESPIPSPMDARTMPVVREEPESPSVKQATKTPEIFEGGEPPRKLDTTTVVPAANEDPVSANSNTSWTETTAYWSRLSQEKRQQIEREALSSDDEPRPAATRKPKPRKTTAAAANGETERPMPRRTMRAQPGPVAAQTAATAADNRAPMKSSMRSGGGSMASSMRDTPSPGRPQTRYSETKAPPQKKTVRPPPSSGSPSATAASAVSAVRPQPPVSRYSQESIYSQDGLAKKTPPRPRAEPPKVSARLQKELAKAEDSDSESSFRKRRKNLSTVDSQGRYSMKRSMRSGSVDRASVSEMSEVRPTSPTKDKSGKFGFRSLSPTFGRNRGTSTRDSSQDSAMRTSLRGPPTTAVKASSQGTDMKTTLRGSQSNAVSQKQTRQTPTTKSKFKSRFGDSDDEDEDAPRRTFFKSRFADSDDESEPASPGVKRADLTPVRGIPRRKGQEDGDSTDLEEEDETNPAERASKRFTALIGPHPGETANIMAAARRNLGLPESSPAAHDVHEGEALSKGSMRQKPPGETSSPTARPADVDFAPPDKKKKKGLMSSLLNRNRNSASSVPSLQPSSPTRTYFAPSVEPVSPQTPQQKVIERPSSPNPIASVSPNATKLQRPSSPGPPTGKLLRRESYQMWMQRTGSEMNLPSSPGATSNLQTLQDRDLNTFVRPPSPPIPDDEPSAAAERPNTSDGVSPDSVKLGRTMRPDPAPRSQSGPTRRVQIQAGEEGSEPGEREPKAVYSQKTGKKKKFGMLRKAFGLND